MKKRFQLLSLLLVFAACSSTQGLPTNNVAVKRYQSYLEETKAVAHMKKGMVYTDKLKNACAELERITGIEAKYYYSYDEVRIPVKADYKNWKKWLRKNKDLLFLENDSVKVSGIPVSLKSKKELRKGTIWF